METIQGESMFPPVKCDCHGLLNCPSKWMGDREVKITARCSAPFGSLGNCDEKEDSVLVTMADYDKYLAGGLVQDVWPMMHAQDREIIIGSRAGYYLCSDCWHYLSEDRLHGRYDLKDITNVEYWEKKI